MKTSPIFSLMLLAIAAIAGLAYVDEEREGAAALADFAQEQTTLAQSIAGALSAHLSALGDPDIAKNPLEQRPELPSAIERYLVAAVHPSGQPERPKHRLVLVQPLEELLADARHAHVRSEELVGGAGEDVDPQLFPRGKDRDRKAAVEVEGCHVVHVDAGIPKRLGHSVFRR